MPNTLWPRPGVQPITGILATVLAALVLAFAWGPNLDPQQFRSTAGWIALFLVAMTLCASRFPIHLRNNAKLMVLTLPLFLMAALLPPALAALAAGAAMLGVTLLLRPVTHAQPSDIATTVGRMTVTVWLGSLLAHVAQPNSLLYIPVLGLAAVVMFAGDMLGTAFEIAGISGEPLRHLVRVLTRESLMPESAQYLVAIAGAIAAIDQPLALGLLALPAALIYVAFKRAKEMQESTRRLLEGMADAIDLRDPYTGGHSRRVAELCRDILAELGIVGPEAELIQSAARVHDIGKISIPDAILRKPGALTADERRVMESHVIAGAELLRRYSDFSRGKDIVMHHHERWDGQGYPARLKGMEIPLGARIIAVADSFDAMTSSRPYRPALTVEHALRTLEQGRGTQWDARAVDALIATCARMRAPAPTGVAESAEPIPAL